MKVIIIKKEGHPTRYLSNVKKAAEAIGCTERTIHMNKIGEGKEWVSKLKTSKGKGWTIVCTEIE